MSRKVRKAKPQTVASTAPAVHDDVLWDLDKLPDGMLHNLGPEPVRITTKSEFKARLHREGKRLKNQQESTLGPEIAPLPEPEAAPIPVAPEFTEGTARVVAAFSSVLMRYALCEQQWCDLCFQRNMNAGCRTTRSADMHSIAIRCNCSIRRYTSVIELSGGTATTALTLGNETVGAIVKADGTRNVPTTLMETDDAKLMLRYYAALRTLKLNNTLQCRMCGEPCEQNVTDDEINIVCGCRIRYFTATKH